MSPVKKKERLIKIDKQRFKKILSERHIKQIGIAEIIGVSPEHLSRCLAVGEIDKDWMNKICEYLNIPINYLTGESHLSPVSSDPYYFKYLEYNKDQYELDKFGKRQILNLFMKSYGIDQEGFCDDLTEKELFSISIIITYAACFHINFFEILGNNIKLIEKLNEIDSKLENTDKEKINELVEQLKGISMEGSEKKEEAAANNNKNERS